MSKVVIPGFDHPQSCKHTPYIEREFKLTPSVYVFAGTSTISAILSKNGYILVDTGTDPERAAKVKARLKEITKGALQGIVLTHGHPDHLGGGTLFLEDAAPDAPVWARANFGSEAAGFKGLEKITGLRGARQFGALIPPELYTPNTMVPKQDKPFGGVPLVRPNQTFAEERKDIAIDGVKLELYAAPGETTDHLFVRLPEEGIIFSGDNIYHSFPNLYPVRGCAYRDVLAWGKSVDKMLNLSPTAVVPGHNTPVQGPECLKMLTDYRDGIMYVYEETIKGMNDGLGPEELSCSIRMPEHLRNSPYLCEFYGCVPWAVRSIYVALLGWFDGNPSNLAILPPLEEARRMEKLAGGHAKLLNAAAEALGAEDYPWAAKLLDYCLRLEPGDQKAKRMKADVLEAMSRIVLPISGINYLLSCALELRRELEGTK